MVNYIPDNIKMCWFINPSLIKKIKWEDINYNPEETINFEQNGNNKTFFVYANRKSDNRLIKVGKAFKNYVFIPILFGVTELLTGISLFFSYIDMHSYEVVIYLLYSILFLLFCLYILDGKEDDVKCLENTQRLNIY